MGAPHGRSRLTRTARGMSRSPALVSPRPRPPLAARYGLALWRPLDGRVQQRSSSRASVSCEGDDENDQGGDDHGGNDHPAAVALLQPSDLDLVALAGILGLPGRAHGLGPGQSGGGRRRGGKRAGGVMARTSSGTSQQWSPDRAPPPLATTMTSAPRPHSRASGRATSAGAVGPLMAAVSSRTSKAMGDDPSTARMSARPAPSEPTTRPICRARVGIRSRRWAASSPVARSSTNSFSRATTAAPR
jgi:hypothetical protein